MLKIDIYGEGKVPIDWSKESSIAECTIFNRMSYRTYKDIEEPDPMDIRDPYKKMADSRQNIYADIRWSTQHPIPVRQDAYSSLEEGILSGRKVVVDWETKILRLENVVQFPSKIDKPMVEFLNIRRELPHPPFRYYGDDIDAAHFGYPDFSYNKEIRSPGNGLEIYECTDFRMRIMSTRMVHVDVETYNKENKEPIGRKLPEDLVKNLFE